MIPFNVLASDEGVSNTKADIKPSTCRLTDEEKELVYQLAYILESINKNPFSDKF
jgi:hypothetical protein